MLHPFAVGIALGVFTLACGGDSQHQTAPTPIAISSSPQPPPAAITANPQPPSHLSSLAARFLQDFDFIDAQTSMFKGIFGDVISPQRLTNLTEL